MASSKIIAIASVTILGSLGIGGVAVASSGGQIPLFAGLSNATEQETETSEPGTNQGVEGSETESETETPTGGSPDTDPAEVSPVSVASEASPVSAASEASPVSAASEASPVSATSEASPVSAASGASAPSSD